MQHTSPEKDSTCDTSGGKDRVSLEFGGDGNKLINLLDEKGISVEKKGEAMCPLKCGDGDFMTNAGMSRGLNQRREKKTDGNITKALHNLTTPKYTLHSLVSCRPDTLDVKKVYILTLSDGSVSSRERAME